MISQMTSPMGVYYFLDDTFNYTKFLLFIVDKPDKDIYNFVGNIRWSQRNASFHHGAVEEQVDALNVENTLWANTVLANGSALVMVIYTGRDTRAVMNTSFPGTKVGLLDLEINQQAKVNMS